MGFRLFYVLFFLKSIELRCLLALHPPRAWWCVFAVFAFSLNGKPTCINKCLSMIQTLCLTPLKRGRGPVV